MKRFFTFLPFVLLLLAMKDKPAYQLFSKEGKPTEYDKMLKELAKADVVLFGEQHNNAISHWLQSEVTKSLFQEHKQQLVLGAEMLEADAQLVLNEYLAGRVGEKNFEAEARLWPNYKTDYKPLISFAKENNLRFVAANVPRRYASAVASNGTEVLKQFSPEAQLLMAPQPLVVDYELPGYKNMIAMFGGAHEGSKGQQMVAAQALKDATMAHFILKNLQPGQKFLHFNGAYHSDNFEGIYWYLKKQRPDLKIVTISTVSQADLKELQKENLNKADFIIAVPENMTTTH